MAWMDVKEGRLFYATEEEIKQHGEALKKAFEEPVDPDEPIKIHFDFNLNPGTEASDDNKIWKMMETISENYEVNDLEDAFGCCTLADAICSYSLEDFIKTFEAYEKERKIIHVGDEVKWAASPRFDPTCGVVIAICDGYYTVLTNSGTKGDYFYTRAVMVNDPTLYKTGSKFPISAKEES